MNITRMALLRRILAERSPRLLRVLEGEGEGYLKRNHSREVQDLLGDALGEIPWDSCDSSLRTKWEDIEALIDEFVS